VSHIRLVSPNGSTSADAEAARVSRGLADVLDAEKRAVDAWLIDALALRPTDRVLEVACGTAGCGVAIAEALAPTGSVLCTDSSPAMVAAAREVVAERHATNVALRELDARALDLPDRSVDGVVSRLGYMVMADPAQALGEAWRVLRPGRRLALSVWSERTHNPWRAVPEEVLFGTPATTPPCDERGPGPFALADLHQLGALLRSVGFADVRVAHIRADHRYASGDEYWETCLRKSSSVRRAYEALDAAARAAAKREVLDQLRGRTVGTKGFVVPAEMLVAAARRPGPRRTL
jgi:SAM-dependent methyltransferase